MAETDGKKKGRTLIGGQPSLGASTADLKALIARAEKEIGANAVFLGSDIPEEMRVPQRATSGSLTLDLALGGGWPLNQWNEIIGHESSGKTTMVLKTIAAMQAIDPKFMALWIDAEGLDLSWASRLGVDLSRLQVIQTREMEKGLQHVVDWLAARACDCVVIDSYPALIASEEDAKDMDDYTMSAGARVLGKFFRKVGSATARSLTEPDRPVLPFMINQWRDHIGGFSPHGTPKITPGGKGKNYSFFTRVEFGRADWITDNGASNGTKVGQTIKAQVIKNKTAPAQRTSYTDFYFDDNGPEHPAGSIDGVKEIVVVAKAYGILEQGGAWFKFQSSEGERKWQGQAAVHHELLGDLSLRAEIEAEVRRLVLHEAP